MEAVKIVVYHAGHGCETGCCGHVIQTEDEQKRGPFAFDHPDPGDDKLQWAKDLVTKHLGAEHVADLDWDQCMIVDDDECTW
jgi:hypothetical protein